MRSSRRLLLGAGLGAAGAVLSVKTASGAEYPPPSRVDLGRVEDGRVVFDPWRSPADTPSPPPPAPLPPGERVGFAIVGLGRLSLEEILPAFGACKLARPAALVSGSPEKMRVVARQYGIGADRCFDYAGFERIAEDKSIRCIYVVLPNAMHREYVERAAAIGVHVLCEKPMATSSADARAMVAACDKAGVKLMIAYRIQYEVFNRRAMQIARDGRFGRLMALHAVNTQTVAADGAAQWRHKRAMSGGGALPDIGLYCLNTARFISGEEPVQVWATLNQPGSDPRFREVEESVAFTLRFPSGLLANCLTSYGARDDKYQRLNFEGAVLDMPNAYAYRGQELHVTARDGADTARTALALVPQNQFAAEMDHMAACILGDARPRTPGPEGVQDQVVMEAIYESARTGRPVDLARIEGRDVFRTPQP